MRSIKTTDLFFIPEAKKNAKCKTHKIWSIKHAKYQLGPSVCKHILCVHAILSCDTTSSIVGIGKGAALKKICRDQYFCTQAEVFYCNLGDTCKGEFITAGENALVCLYNGKDEGLDSLCYKKFC